jgi:hypothetical protein
MKKLKLFALTAVALMGVTGVANAETAMLAQDDFVGISFWVISMGMLAATAFFFMERSSVNPGMENISNCCWSCNWYCIHPLHVHERCMGNYW